MTRLADLQRTFLQELFQEDPVQILTEIRPSTLTPQQQFKLYQDGILLRLQKTLSDIYPVCKKLVGEPFFEKMTQEFISLTPSHVNDLNLYGDTFPAFIATYRFANSLPYLSDVAKLEWAWHYLYGAPDASALDFNKLGEAYNTNPESIRFLLPKRSTLLTSSYPIFQIWESNQDSFSGNTDITLSSDTHYLFIWHAQQQMYIEEISAQEFGILSWLQAGITFGTLCENITLNYPEIAIPDLISTWINKGWIIDFS